MANFPRYQFDRHRIPAVAILVLATLAAMAWPAAGASAETAASFGPADWPLVVHFFDVDQGDAILLQGEDFTMLIDAGRHDRADVVPYLERAGVEFIDLFIVTHPHADHIGQCAAVMRRFPVGEVWLSGQSHTTLTFERCIDAILESDAGYHEPRAGEAYQVGSARVEVLHPADLSGSINDNSIVVRVVYGEVALLMTGDAEVEAELSMLRRGHDLAADVLKMGHHGSSTSSGAVFLQAVQPSVAVYSAGRDNPYGHPHRETLRTVERLGIPLFGTDVHGTVRVATDGRELAVFVERLAEGLGPPYWTGAGAADARFFVGVRGTGAGGSGAAVKTVSSAFVCAAPLVNLNTASAEELTRLVHVGPAIAKRIVEARPFKSVEDLLRVSGIGHSRLADILAQGLACVDGP